jgi:flavin-dependent thymidylate synthase
MSKTIRSSWEFIDMTFLVGGVSRACAQQMTRTRNASFAMQSQRVADVSEMEVFMPERIAADKVKAGTYKAAVNASVGAYKRMLQDGFTAVDARGVLPMNITCNLVAKYNMRAFVDLMKTRTSLRAQGEYADVARAMKACVLTVWPWSKPFFADEHATAIEMIEGVAKKLGLTPGNGDAWELAKAVDLLRKA